MASPAAPPAAPPAPAARGWAALLVALFAALSARAMAAPPLVTSEVVAAKSWATWGGLDGRELTNTAAGPQVRPVVRNGDSIFLKAFYGGKYLDTEGVQVRARRAFHGTHQAFVIDKFESGDIYPGDRVFLTGSSGRRLAVEGDTKALTASNTLRGPYQEFVLEVLEGTSGGPIRVGDNVYLRAHTGNMIDVIQNEVGCRFGRKDGYQVFVVEKPTSSF